MASQAPSAQKRRELVASRSPELAAAARAFAEASRWGEALECLEAQPDPELLGRARQWALAEGDLFVYRRALALAGEEARADELESLAAAARAKGKDAHAKAAQDLLQPAEDQA
jgi:hypothetical protein